MEEKMYSENEKEEITLTVCEILNYLYARLLPENPTDEQQTEAYTSMLNALCLSISAIGISSLRKEAHEDFLDAVKNCIRKNLTHKLLGS
jgi:hypothetical protein